MKSQEKKRRVVERERSPQRAEAKNSITGKQFLRHWYQLSEWKAKKSAIILFEANRKTLVEGGKNIETAPGGVTSIYNHPRKDRS